MNLKLKMARANTDDWFEQNYCLDTDDAKYGIECQYIPQWPSTRGFKLFCDEQDAQLAFQRQDAFSMAGLAPAVHSTLLKVVIPQTLINALMTYDERENRMYYRGPLRRADHHGDTDYITYGYITESARCTIREAQRCYLGDGEHRKMDRRISMFSALMSRLCSASGEYENGWHDLHGGNLGITRDGKIVIIDTGCAGFEDYTANNIVEWAEELQDNPLQLV